MCILSRSAKKLRYLNLIGMPLILVFLVGCNSSSSDVSTKNDGLTEKVHESESGSSSVPANANLGTSASSVRVPPTSAIQFEELKDSDITFVREDDMRGMSRIFESTGGGVGALDFDRDGLMDLLFLGGCKLPEEANSGRPTCVLYRQNRPLKFTDCTLKSSMLKSGYCQGVAVGDWDNDGFDDVYITALGPNAFFFNNGDGTFSDRTEELGLRMGDWSTSCAMADLNLDGNLDLYVVTYLADSIHAPLLCTNPRSPTGYEQCPPSKYKGVDDRLFLNDGNGGAIDVTNSSGLAGLGGKGLGVAICDFDRDGKPEIYVANDGEANFLFQTAVDDQGTLKLTEIAMASGCALSRSGYAQASMGIAVGDYDNNGTLDLHLTNFYGDTNTIYKNSGDLKFADVTRSSGVTSPSKSLLGWGTVFADFDNDGWLDLFVTNGHVEDRTWAGRGEPFFMPPLLLRNTGKGGFEDVSKNCGEYFQKNWMGRGVVNLDINQDGLTDLIISHQLSESRILINRTPAPSRPSLRIIGVQSNRNGKGVKLEYLGKSGELLGFHELVSGGSYLSSSVSDVPVYPPESVDVRVHWPSGKTATISLKESTIVELVEY